VSQRWAYRGVLVGACVAAVGAATRAGAQGRAAPPAASSFALSAFGPPGVAVSGPLTPGAPVAITLTVRALLPTRPAVISVSLPDLWYYEWRRQHPGASDIGQRPTPVGEWSVALDSGQVFTRTVSVVIPYAGYYRISLQARGPDGMVRGTPVQQYAGEQVWLLVDECGGRVLPGMSLRDLTVAPIERARPNIGPFHVHGRLRPAPPSCP